MNSSRSGSRSMLLSAPALQEQGLSAMETQRLPIRLHSCSRLGRPARCMRPRRLLPGSLRAQSDDQRLSLVGLKSPRLSYQRRVSPVQTSKKHIVAESIWYTVISVCSPPDPYMRECTYMRVCPHVTPFVFHTHPGCKAALPCQDLECVHSVISDVPTLKSIRSIIHQLDCDFGSENCLNKGQHSCSISSIANACSSI